MGKPPSVFRRGMAALGTALTAEEIRVAALDAAVRSRPPNTSEELMIGRARKFEEYLTKG